MEAKEFDLLNMFCIEARREVEKRIAHCRMRRNKVPQYLTEYSKLFSLRNWTMVDSSLLNRCFISKTFDDSKQMILYTVEENKIIALSVVHILSKNVIACEMSFGMKPNAFVKYILPQHYNLAKDYKAKMIIYPVVADDVNNSFERYTKRKSTDKLLKRLRKHENPVEFEGVVRNIYYLKIAKKESFMSLMKELL